MEYRIEKDSLGEMKCIKDALYGAQTLRALNNFNIISERVPEVLIESLAKVKKACAMANESVRTLPLYKTQLIIGACDEIIEGAHRQWFVTTAIQGGAGTSINMNMNEVIANRCAQLLGEPLGLYKTIHPNDDVNHAQSTNDVIPTAAKVAILVSLKQTLIAMKALRDSFNRQAKENEDVLKVGRTHLQDAVLMTMGQVFHSFATVLNRDINRIENALEEMTMVNLGATAVGTEINTVLGYKENAVAALSTIVGYPFTSVNDLVDGTKNVDSFVFIHSLLKGFSINLSRICSDLRLMASGPKAGFGEITLPSVQPGSSIMPGKVNPVICEVCNQACFQVIGNDTTITLAAEAGQMELNVFEPVMFYNILQSISILENACLTLKEKAIDGLLVNRQQCHHLVENSLAMSTALTEVLGYTKTSEITKQALKENKSLREIIIAEHLLTEQQLSDILVPEKMIRKHNL